MIIKLTIFQTVRVIQTVQEAVAVASIGVVKSSCLYSVQECIKISVKKNFK